MTGDRDSAPDAAALLSAFAGLPDVDPNVIGRAQQAMATAMAAGAEHRALLDQQWAIMQATAAAVRGGEGAQGATDQPLDPAQQLEQARACFDIAVEAVLALSEAAYNPGGETMDDVVARFYEEMKNIHDTNNN